MYKYELYYQRTFVTESDYQYDCYEDCYNEAIDEIESIRNYWNKEDVESDVEDFDIWITETDEIEE